MDTNINIIQATYGRIEVDNSEKDIVQIWMFERNGEIMVIQVEKENIKILIEALQKCGVE